MKQFLAALQFLTIIPVKVKDVTEEDYAKSAAFFPLAGLVIGALLVLFNAVISSIMPLVPASVFVLILWVAVTGALHLDGLADTFDGFYASSEKEKILNVMDDSATGAKGAAVLVTLLLFKFALLVSLEGNLKVWALILAPVISRYSMLLAMKNSVPARSEGMGKLFIGRISLQGLVAGSVITGAIVCASLFFLQLKMLGVIALAAGVLAGLTFAKYCDFKIEGMTGDTLGALNEIVEVAVLIVMVSVSFMRGVL